MMLKPYMNELLKKVHNRYLLVNVTARRARDVAEQSEESGIALEKKPVSIALEEIYDGKGTKGIYEEQQANAKK